MIYRYKPGQWMGVPAQLAGERIEAIRDKRGVVRAADVVQDARSPKSPLHPCFTWDDRKAAESWRIREAGALLRAIVTVPDEKPESEPVRAFIAIGESNEAHDYMPLAVVMGDVDLRRKALATALRELNRLKERYGELEELAVLWQALDRVAA